MKKDSDHSAGTLKTEKTGLLAEENQFDRRTLWRIGTWGLAAVGAVVMAVMANQASLGWRRGQVAATDLSRQAQQLQSIARDSQSETRRLAAAVDTLNNDRDRLYARVTVLEQGLDSVTGAIGRQSSATPSGSKSAAATPVPANTADPQPAPTTSATLPAIGPALAALSPTAPSTSPPGEKPRAESVKGDPKTDQKTDVKAIRSEAMPDMRAEPKPETKPDLKPDPKPEIKPEVEFGPDQASLMASSVALAANPSLPATSVGTPGATTAAAASVSVMGPPDGVTSKFEPLRPASAGPAPAPAPMVDAMASAKESDPPDVASDMPAVRRTEFAVDLGTANSVNGLRALWRGLVKANASLAELHPIIMIKEGNTGLGMQLRLAAGPLRDAAAAAKICAALVGGERTCETTVYDGQRLAMPAEETPAKPLPGASKPNQYKRYPPRHAAAAAAAKREEPPPPSPQPQPQPPKAEPSSISSLFKRGN